MKKKAYNKGLILSTVIVIFLFLYFVDGLEILHLNLYDVIYEKSDDISQDIVIVGIDDNAYANIGRWPFARDVQAKIFGNILDDKPAVLGIDIIYDSKQSAIEDQALVEVLDSDLVVLAKSFNETGQDGTRKYQSLIEPFDQLNDRLDSGYINSEPSEIDGVVRNTGIAKMFEGEIVYSFSHAIYNKLVELDYQSPLRGEFAYVGKSYFIDFVGKPNSYDMISADAVYRDSIPQDFF